MDDDITLPGGGASPSSDQDLDKEPTLPGIPHFPEFYRGNKSVINSRKRVKVDDASLFMSTSSDPAVFSSDDDPALENVGKRKKRYVGSWFRQMPASSDSALGEDSEASSSSRSRRKPKRTLKRQFDSGVYVDGGEMAASSDEELDGKPYEPPGEVGYEEEPPCRAASPSHYELHTAHLSVPWPDPLSDAYSKRLALERAMPSPFASEPEIRDYFQALVEYGEDKVDLSNLGLQSISNATISLLSDITRIPQVVEDVEFEQPETSIRLIMANNPLTRVPKAIFQLENLTTLSLRHNNLVELPSSIAECKNLQYLNLSYNRLRYLPGELLDMIRGGGPLIDLPVFGNPFYKPGEPGNAEGDDVSAGEPPPGDPCRTPVQYSDTAGVAYSDFRLDEREHVPIEPAWQLAPPTLSGGRFTPHDAVATRASHVPTLLELALLSAVRASKNDVSLADHLGQDAPKHLRAMLDDVATARYQGLPRCCVCSRAFIRPRTQWLEFTEDDFTEEQLLKEYAPDPLLQVRIVRAPFIRRGCSWGCVPELSPRKVEGSSRATPEA